MRLAILALCCITMTVCKVCDVRVDTVRIHRYAESARTIYKPAGMLLTRTQSRAHHAAWTRHIPSDDRPGYATSHADWVLFARASAFGSTRSDRDDLVSVNFAWRKSRMAISRISDLIRQVIIGATCCDARCAGRWRTADELRLKKQGRGSRHTSIHRKRRIIQWV